MKTKKKIFWRWFLFVLYIVSVMCFMFFTLQTGEDSAEQSKGVTDVVVEVIEDITNKELDTEYDTIHTIVRKGIGHFGYCVFMGILLFWLVISFNKSGKYALVIILVVGALVSATSEFLQYIPASRGPNMVDGLIDYCGHLIGGGISFLLFIKINRINWKIS